MSSIWKFSPFPLVVLYRCFQTWPLGKIWRMAPEFTQSSPFTHAQHSGRFSAQTRSQQQQILRIIPVRGGAAGCSRQRQEVTLTPLRRSIDSVDSTRHCCQLFSPQTLLTSSSVSSTWMTALFHLGNICFLFLFSFPAGDPLLCSHSRFSCISPDSAHMHLLWTKYGGTVQSSTCLKALLGNVCLRVLRQD